MSDRDQDTTEGRPPHGEAADSRDAATVRPSELGRRATGPGHGSGPPPDRVEEPAGRAGDRFGDFELLEEIARGGMGVVFKARQVSLNRLVALKMILSGRLANEADLLRFRREALAAAHLDHPNIVPVYEVGERDGCPFLAMGFVGGESLAHRVARSPLPPRDAAEVIRTVAGAMAYAHSRGVIHRDLKPSNILIGLDGRPRVTDFGIAKRAENESGLTATGQVVGTPSYMPPEQAQGKKDKIGPAVDVYALGAVLYTLLVGHPPFQGASLVDTIRQVILQEPVAPRRLNPEVPRDLETICLKCLEKEPQKRYAGAEALADDLGHFLAGEPIRARAAGAPERAWLWCRRNPKVAGVLAGFLAAALAGFGVITGLWLAAERDRRRAWEAVEEEKGSAARLADPGRDDERAVADLGASLVALSAAREGGREAPWPGDVTRAVAAYQGACRRTEARLAAAPDPGLRARLVCEYAALGALYDLGHREQAALGAYRQAVAQLPHLAAAPPERLGDLGRLGAACFLAGAALAGRGHAPEASAPLAQAAAHLRAALGRSPGRANLRQALSRSLARLGEVQRALGQPADAAATAKQRWKLWPADAEEVFDVARELARCVKAFGAGAALTRAEASEQRRCSDLALAALRQAIDLGLPRPGHALDDPELAPLRDRDDFQKLRALHRE